MVRNIAALALACAAVQCAGCATIVHGTTERVQIDSTPSGAEVAIDDSQRVITPSAVDLSRGSAHKLVFHKPGYQDTTETLTSGVSGWILGNLLAGGVVGMAIDASDGAARQLSADRVNIALTPLPALPPKAAAGSPQGGAPEVPPDLPALFMHDAQPAVAPTQPHGPPPDFSDD